MRALAKLLAVAVLVASPAALAQRAAPGKTKTPAAAPARAFVKITKEELEKMALAEITALGAKPGSRPTRGARLMEVRAPGPIELPAPVVRREVELSQLPRRAGSVTAAATLVLFTEAGEAARIALTAHFVLPAEAAVYEVPKGSIVTLMLQRGLIEVSAQAVTSADADVGDVVPVMVRPSGKTLRAKVVSRDRVLVAEGEK